MVASNEIAISAEQAERYNALAPNRAAASKSLGYNPLYQDAIRTARNESGGPVHLSDRPLLKQRFERIVNAACISPKCFEVHEVMVLRAALMTGRVSEAVATLIDEMHGVHFA